jgi:hypothetical protein
MARLKRSGKAAKPFKKKKKRKTARRSKR